MVDLKKTRETAEVVRMLKRAAQGLGIDEKDIMSFLINAEDIRERTRLSEHDVYGHSAMRTLADTFDEMSMWRTIADMEDHYFISGNEGEGRKEAILMQRAKVEPQAMTTTPLTIQMPQTKPEEPPKPEKKGLFHR